MFLLDTNVISELRRAGAGEHPRRHLGQHDSSRELFLSAISILEIELGTLQIARRDAAQGAVLRAWIDDQILPRFEGRILTVDTAVAQRCAHFTFPIHARNAMP